MLRLGTKAPLTAQQLTTLLQGFLCAKGSSTLVSVVLWSDVFELRVVQDVVLTLGFKVRTWYKHNFTC